MSFFYKVLLDWAYGKLAGLFLYLKKKFETISKYKEIIDVNDKQAEVVEKLRLQIIELIKQGKPVPDDLKEQLRVENDKLASGTFIPNRSK